MVKFIHIRRIDDDGLLSPYGGATIAYSSTKKDIVFNYAICRGDDGSCNSNTGKPIRDLFCYRIGRQVAAGRLKKHGAVEVLERKDPMIPHILDWFCKNVFVGEITVKWNPAFKRWESDFVMSPPADAEFVLEEKEKHPELDAPPLILDQALGPAAGAAYNDGSS